MTSHQSHANIDSTRPGTFAPTARVAYPALWNCLGIEQCSRSRPIPPDRRRGGLGVLRWLHHPGSIVCLKDLLACYARVPGTAASASTIPDKDSLFSPGHNVRSGTVLNLLRLCDCKKTASWCPIDEGFRCDDCAGPGISPAPPSNSRMRRTENAPGTMI